MNKKSEEVARIIYYFKPFKRFIVSQQKYGRSFGNREVTIFPLTTTGTSTKASIRVRFMLQPAAQKEKKIA